MKPVVGTLFIFVSIFAMAILIFSNPMMDPLQFVMSNLPSVIAITVIFFAGFGLVAK